jgi:hypothetical protein
VTVLVDDPQGRRHEMEGSRAVTSGP